MSRCIIAQHLVVKRHLAVNPANYFAAPSTTFPGAIGIVQNNDTVRNPLKILKKKLIVFL